MGKDIEGQTVTVEDNVRNAGFFRRYLVAARTDRGRIAVGRARIEQTVRELGFDGFFETSARDGSGVAELQAALRAAVPWESLVQVSSTQQFKRIKDFLLEQKELGRLLPGEEELFLAFKAQPDSAIISASMCGQRICSPNSSHAPSVTKTGNV